MESTIWKGQMPFNSAECVLEEFKSNFDLEISVIGNLVTARMWQFSQFRKISTATTSYLNIVPARISDSLRKAKAIAVKVLTTTSLVLSV